MPDRYPDLNETRSAYAMADVCPGKLFCGEAPTQITMEAIHILRGVRRGEHRKSAAGNATVRCDGSFG
jgi:hypothetical protein